MNTVKIGGKVVTLYDSIEEMPMRRFHKYNKMMIIDAGIGSDVADVDKHLEKAIAYIGSNMPDAAATELENMRQNIFFVQNDVSPRFLSFAALVHSVDGVPCEDISDDGLAKVVQMFADAPVGDVTASLEAVKKKIDGEIDAYFPKLFDSAAVKEYYDMLRRRTLTLLEGILSGDVEGKTPEVARLTRALLTHTTPRRFSGSDNFEADYDRQFDTMSFTISEHLNVGDPKGLTVREYYSAFELVQKKMKSAASRKGPR